MLSKPKYVIEVKILKKNRALDSFYVLTTT